MIAVIDYGRGNLASVTNALRFLGADYFVADQASLLAKADALILPGVGAFDDAIASLNSSGMADSIRDFAAENKPFLGICLGLQLLFESSEEGSGRGLGILAGTCRHLQTDTTELSGRAQLKVPHMGWNQLHTCTDKLLAENSEFYFVHSFYVCPDDKSLVSAYCNYGTDFVAAVQRGRLRACQFHPEKSGSTGLGFLQGFLDELKL